MADRDVAGGILLALAGLCLLAVLLAGAWPVAVAYLVVGLFLTLAAGLVLVLGPTPDQRAARRRNPHARRIR